MILEEGNYWKDYTGKGYYQIDGFASSQDLYPLKKQIQASVDFQFLFVCILFIPISYFVCRRKKRRN
ncbi:MAG: hypothetical protein V3V41_07670 [Candidatus Heimdallarchaeota archaeon]